MLHDRMWNAERAYLVGGGPSLATFQWDRLAEKKHVIAVNRAFLDVPTAELFFTEDLRVIERYAAQLNMYSDMGGTVVYHALAESYAAQASKLVPDARIIARRRDDKFWSDSLSEGLTVSSNSAVGAANLADIFGVSTLYLLGMDCSGTSKDGRFMANYHEDYEGPDWRVSSDQLDTFASDWEHWVKRKACMRIVNVVNPKRPSALKCFETMTFQECFP